MNNYEATKQTNTWLRQNGIDPEIFNKLDVEILQAQMIATNLLKHHGKLLDQNEAASLNNFLQATRNAKVIPPFCTEARSRTVMQPWPVAAWG